MNIRIAVTSLFFLLSTAVVSNATAAEPELAKKSGCLACHAEDRKVIGPSFKDVAEKYKGHAGAKATLVEKVKKGSKGNWTAVTGGASMPPYSPRVPDKDIETLIDYVMSLAKYARPVGNTAPIDALPCLTCNLRRCRLLQCRVGQTSFLFRCFSLFLCLVLFCFSCLFVVCVCCV